MSTPIPPKIAKIVQEDGEIDDELDYALMNYLLKNRGEGFTACQPKLVQLEDGRKAIVVSIDNTFINSKNQIMGLGIVGNIFIDYDTLKIIYCTPLEDLEKNIQKLKDHGITPQERPKGKY
jgi:hypothetical protein